MYHHTFKSGEDKRIAIGLKMKDLMLIIHEL